MQTLSWQQALQQNPPIPLFVEAALQKLHQGLAAEAISICEQGLARLPEHLEGRICLAYALAAVGHRERAEAEAAALSASYPNAAEVRALLRELQVGASLQSLVAATPPNDQSDDDIFVLLPAAQLQTVQEPPPPPSEVTRFTIDMNFVIHEEEESTKPALDLAFPTEALPIWDAQAALLQEDQSGLAELFRSKEEKTSKEAKPTQGAQPPGTRRLNRSRHEAFATVDETASEEDLDASKQTIPASVVVDALHDLPSLLAPTAPAGVAALVPREEESEHTEANTSIEPEIFEDTNVRAFSPDSIAETRISRNSAVTLAENISQPARAVSRSVVLDEDYEEILPPTGIYYDKMPPESPIQPPALPVPIIPVPPPISPPPLVSPPAVSVVPTAPATEASAIPQPRRVPAPTLHLAALPVPTQSTGGGNWIFVVIGVALFVVLSATGYFWYQRKQSEQRALFASVSSLVSAGTHQSLLTAAALLSRDNLSEDERQRWLSRVETVRLLFFEEDRRRVIQDLAKESQENGLFLRAALAVQMNMSLPEATSSNDLWVLMAASFVPSAKVHLPKTAEIWPAIAAAQQRLLQNEVSAEPLASNSILLLALQLLEKPTAETANLLRKTLKETAPHPMEEAWAQLALAFHANQLGDSNTASSALRTLRTSSVQNGLFQLLLAELSFAQGDLVGAQTLLQKASTYNDTDRAQLLGSVILYASGQGSQIVPDRAEQKHFAEGLLLLYKHEYAGAAQAFALVSIQNSAYQAALWYRCRALLGQNNLQEAKTLWKQLSMSPLPTLVPKTLQTELRTNLGGS